MIICGSGSLPREEEEEDQDLNNNNSHERSFHSAQSSPRKSCSTRRIKAHKNHHHHHHKNNPYATRGLDKFVALLAEIEEKKQRIYSKNNPEEISLVQFDYSNGNKGKPVVIRVKDAKKTTKADHLTAKIAAVRDDHHDKSEAQDHIQVKAVSDNSKKKKGLLRKLRKPSYYLSAVLILILIFLVLFGRSVAILCTSIIWYAIPAISNRNLNSTRSIEKKGELGTNSGKA